MVPVPAAAVMLPPSHAPAGPKPLKPSGEAIARPGGNLSIKPTPVRSPAPSIRNVRVVLSPTIIEPAPKNALMVGGLCARPGTVSPSAINANVTQRSAQTEGLSAAERNRHIWTPVTLHELLSNHSQSAAKSNPCRPFEQHSREPVLPGWANIPSLSPFAGQKLLAHHAIVPGANPSYACTPVGRAAGEDVVWRALNRTGGWTWRPTRRSC
jgi:hypothetical protein